MNQAFREALRDGNVGEVKRLIAVGLDVNDRDQYGSTPIEEAIDYNDELNRPGYRGGCLA